MTGLIDILNKTGDGFCRFALAMLIQSGVLVVLLYLIDLLIRRYARAAFRYCIWMLVLVKLVLPVSLSSPVSVGRLFGDSLTINKMETTVGTESDNRNHKVIVEVPVGPAVSKKLDAAGSTARSAEWSRGFVEGQIYAVQKAENGPVEPVAITWQAVVFVAWLVGVLVFSILLFRRFLFVRGLLAQSEITRGRLEKVLQQCCRQVGLRRNIELRVSKKMLSPAACGLFKPVILMPASLLGNLTGEKLKAVLIHELAHIKRGDLWVNFIQTILQIVYFYNPLLWFANAVVRDIREKAVDEMVLVRLADEAGSYSNILMEIAEFAFSRPRFGLKLVGVVESKKALTGRIKHILSRPLPKTTRLGVAGLAFVLLLGIVALPMGNVPGKGNGPAPEPANRFAVTLPGGVTVELVGICDYPSRDKQWWRPDGTALERQILVKDFDNVTAGGRAVVVVARISGSGDINFKWGRIDGSYYQAFLEVVDSMGRVIDDMSARKVHIDEKLKETSIRLGVASGPWKIIATHNGKGMMNVGSGERVITFADVQGFGRGTKLIVYDDLLEYEHRIIAIDSKGVLHYAHTTEWSSWGSADKVRQTTAYFSLSPGKIRQFQFQIRPYRWITFKNVSLRPTHKTDVEIEAGNAGTESTENVKKAEDSTQKTEKPARQAGDPQDILPGEVTAIIKTLSEWIESCVAGNLEGIKKTCLPDEGEKAKRDLRDMKELLSLNPEWDFALLAVFWKEDEAMAVSKALRDGDPKIGEPMALVWTLKKQNKNWLIAEVDLEDLEGLQIENSRFMRNHPGANVWFAGDNQIIEAEIPLRKIEESGAGRYIKAMKAADLKRIIEEQLIVLREFKIGDRERWFAAVKRLIEIGPPAVPALCEEIRNAKRPKTQSVLAFVLRAIGDPRAVPALIDALENSGFSSDYGVGKADTELAKFIRQYQIDPVCEGIRLGRPVREITIALERLTGHTEGHAHFFAYDENGRLLAGSYIITPEVMERQRMHRKEVARRWREWWKERMEKRGLEGGVLAEPEGSLLEFHIVPRSSEETLGDLTGQAIQEYRQNLLNEGPSAGIIRGDYYQWYRVDKQLKIPEDFIVQEYKGGKYLLLCARAKYSIWPPTGTSKTWGLKRVYVAEDIEGKPAIGLWFDENGSEQFYRLTRENIGRALAIVIDGKVVSAPVIEAAIRDKVRITGPFSREQAEEIKVKLQKGMASASLPQAPAPEK